MYKLFQTHVTIKLWGRKHNAGVFYQRISARSLRLTPSPNKIEPAVIKRALKLYREGELSNAEICKTCGISWGTLYNYAKQQGIKRRTLPPRKGRRPPEPIQDFKGCLKCKNVKAEPQYNVLDFPDTANGTLIYRAVACRGCNKEYFKTVDMRTGEAKTFLLR